MPPDLMKYLLFIFFSSSQSSFGCGTCPAIAKDGQVRLLNDGLIHCL